MTCRLLDLLVYSDGIEAHKYTNIISKTHLIQMCTEILPVATCMNYYTHRSDSDKSDGLSVGHVSSSAHASASVEPGGNSTVASLNIGLILKVYALARCLLRERNNIDTSQISHTNDAIINVVGPIKPPFGVDVGGAAASLKLLDELCADLPPDKVADTVADSIAVNAGQFALAHEFSHHLLGHTHSPNPPTNEIAQGLELLADLEAWRALFYGLPYGVVSGAAPGASLWEAWQRRTARAVWYILAVMGECGESHPSSAERLWHLSVANMQMFHDHKHFWANPPVDTLCLMAFERRNLSDITATVGAPEIFQGAADKAEEALKWLRAEHGVDPRRRILCVQPELR